MDVVEKRTPDALEAVKRQALKRRSIYVHDAVVARLDACERKRDSFRGSGLQYVLKGLNRYCHQLSPDKLLEALRIVSQNQMFDRWTLYNLYRSIHRNVLYFGSTQHSKLMEYISECLSYTVQGYGGVAAKDYEQVSSELYNILLPDATVETNTTDVIPMSNHRDLMNQLDISAFDGGPVPLSELNRLSRDIVMGVYQAYTTGGQTYRRALLGPFSLCHIYKSCLDVLLKLYPAVIVDPGSVLDICESLSRQLEIISQDVTMHKDLIAFGNTVCDAVNMVLFSKMKRIVNTTDRVSRLPMDVHRQMDIDLLQLDKELESSYINGNTTLQPLVVSSFFSCLKMSKIHATVHQFDILENIVYRLRHLCGVPLNDQYIESQLRLISHMISYQELFSNIQSPCQVPGEDTYNKGLHKVESLGPMKHCRYTGASIGTTRAIGSDNTPEISPREDQSKVELSQHVDISSATMYQRKHSEKSTSYVGSFPGDQIVIDTFIKDCIGFIKERTDILYKVSVKTICHLVAIIASIHGKPTVDLKDILRSCFYRCSVETKSLTNPDILYLISTSYTQCDYIHQFAARTMLNTAFYRHTITNLDTIVTTRLHLLALSIPYNMVSYVDPKSFIDVSQYVNKVTEPLVSSTTQDNVSLCTDNMPWMDTVFPRGHISDLRVRIRVNPDYNQRVNITGLSSTNKPRHRFESQECIYSSYKVYPRHTSDKGYTPLQNQYLYNLWKTRGLNHVLKAMSLLR